ncbi:SDR family oxidoreductase [Telmatospirillum sp. J64-1]|uniref:SDR family oxidoreductase n=1 Tax=Telmatospirillum sp. J64-1 TaxID=2502183 RepID=UPI00115CB7AA|nr:SDR family oxidoreductase [Telmatospirillum sp. J64-1]
MELGLKGKRAVVLGATRGLGRGIADQLAAEGAKVLLCGRSLDRLQAAADEIAAKGGSAEILSVDLADEKAAQAIIEAAGQKLGGVDVLVLNSGGPPAGPTLGVPSETWSAQFQQMVLRLIELGSAALPGMQANGWGRVLLIASSGVVQPIPNLGISNALRASLVAWAKTVSQEVARDGVTVNVIVPGRIGTERVAELDEGAAKRSGKSVEEVAAQSRATIPAGRYGSVEEFASVATFLCSAPASYVTGSVIRVDGGLIRSI